jgi:dTMP kinase
MEIRKGTLTTNQGAGPKIIVIEGVDGAGKTTQINFLKEKLNPEKNIFFREPGSTKSGQEIRSVILDNILDAKTELLLFYSARNELILNEIIPALESGKNVIIDRFELSSYAYQIYGRKRPDLKNFIDGLSKNIVPENFVDKYYFFDLDVKISKQRENKREEETSRFDAEGEEFFNNVRNRYKKEIINFNHKIINSSKDIEEVRKEFFIDVLKFLK